MGLKGREIPLFSRIISVADAFDVMINDRPYKKVMSIGEAVEEIKRNSGTQFDPEIVNIFIKSEVYKINK
nr:HD domain-containing phosphohydrolase [Thermoanaerobacter pentosaceus]